MREEQMADTTKEETFVSDEEVNIMPAIEMIEYERVAYVKEMEEYLKELKKMKKHDAKKKSFENLVQSNIICENGDFTEQYEYTIGILKEKRQGYV